MTEKERRAIAFCSLSLSFYWWRKDDKESRGREGQAFFRDESFRRRSIHCKTSLLEPYVRQYLGQKRKTHKAHQSTVPTLVEWFWLTIWSNRKRCVHAYVGMISSISFSFYWFKINCLTNIYPSLSLYAFSFHRSRCTSIENKQKTLSSIWLYIFSHGKKSPSNNIAYQFFNLSTHSPWILWHLFATCNTDDGNT